jgi:glutamate-1-semialdehyde 2,1-aminomutase
MELVAPIGPVYQAGTLSANPVGMRAGLATLRKLEAAGAYDQLETKTKTFCDRLNSELQSRRLEFEVARQASIFWLHRKTEKPIRRIEQIPSESSASFAQVFHAALDRGVYLAPSAFEVNFMSLAHSDELLERAHEAIVNAVGETR